jgi:hypothetical protein
VIPDRPVPNVFGEQDAPWTDREIAELAAIMADPLVHRWINVHLRNEYAMLLTVPAVRANSEELARHMAYIQGAYALAKNLLNLPQPAAQ